MDDVAGKNASSSAENLLNDPEALQAHILKVIRDRACNNAGDMPDSADGAIASSVMFLLGLLEIDEGSRPEICVVLNKRSKIVRQSGDLCCPGGTVEEQMDPYLARLLRLPFLPLNRWPLRSTFQRNCPHKERALSLLLATALREAWEEMRLNPFGVRFLGPLPSQRLLLFKRVIYPMVGWIGRQRRFVPSWEVEKIVAVPLRSLLNPALYANYRIYLPPSVEKKINLSVREMPCFLHRERDQTEILWGATYKIVVHFMELIFAFKPPDVATLPLVPGIMDEDYLNFREP